MEIEDLQMDWQQSVSDMFHLRFDKVGDYDVPLRFA